MLLTNKRVTSIMKRDFSFQMNDDRHKRCRFDQNDTPMEPI